MATLGAETVAVSEKQGKFHVLSSKKIKYLVLLYLQCQIKS
jgi:hypothetical protein